jgi:citrate/tricarballylate utilization protein
MAPDGVLEEAARQLTVCNACRYCEGLCAVFPALERRSVIMPEDVAYLANLCHDCRACFEACMYTPPHEFAVNIPVALADARITTYQSYTWPRWLGSAFRNAAIFSAVAAAVGLALAALAVSLSGGWSGFITSHQGPGSFYQIITFPLMLIPALLAALYVIGVLAVGCRALWRDAEIRARDLGSAPGSWAAILDAITFRYWKGGGGGCYAPHADAPSAVRRRLHAAVFWGFTLTFVSTVLAAIWQDLLGDQPPFPILSPPVVAGVIGGALIIVGATGLLSLKVRSPLTGQEGRPSALDSVFLVLLDVASATGLLVLALRTTPALGPLLTIHLASLVALFAAAPYGKFVHGAYRFTALVLNRAEARAEESRLALRSSPE